MSKLFDIWNLELGNYLFFGACDLGFKKKETL